MLAWLVLIIQSNDNTLGASVVAVKPYTLLHIFKNKVDRSPVKYSTVSSPTYQALKSGFNDFLK